MTDKLAFVYAIYIDSTADKIWNALLDGEFTRQYWDADNLSDWQVGSRWEHRRTSTKSTAILGEVLEAARPHRLGIVLGAARG